jgi:hypothetical protein
MMSINGMISIRACFFGMGDRIFMVKKSVGRASQGKGDRDSDTRSRAGQESRAPEG